MNLVEKLVTCGTSHSCRFCPVKMSCKGMERLMLEAADEILKLQEKCKALNEEIIFLWERQR